MIRKPLLLVFAACLPPGAGYMYMGLIKRGLSAMICFFFMIFVLTTDVSAAVKILTAFSIFILYIACIFDSFNIARRLNAGEAVEDGVGSLIGDILSNKRLCALIFIILAIIFASTILGFVIRVLQTLVPLILIAFGLYVVLRRKK